MQLSFQALETYPYAKTLILDRFMLSAELLHHKQLRMEVKSGVRNMNHLLHYRRLSLPRARIFSI